MTTNALERPRSQTGEPQTPSFSWAMAFAFAAFTLATGMLAAWIGFSLVKPIMPPLTLNYPAYYPPLWAFWAVWLVIYPCWGIATYLVWRQRRSADVRGALVLYAQTLLGNILFVPIQNLVGGAPAVLTLMDANGLISAGLMAWLYSRYVKSSVYWLLPLLLWMPTTFLIKIGLWVANPM